MKRRWSTLVAMAAATVLFVGLSSAFATSDTHHTDDSPRLDDVLRLENVTLPWFMPLKGGTCTLPASVGEINPVDNSGDRLRKVTSKVRADGSQVIVQDDLKTGKAKDSNGNVYHFIYTNRVVFHVSPGLPADVNVRMTDNFRLYGNRLHMIASFDWRWTYTAPDGVKVTLEPSADFPVEGFVFATADGVNPAPGVTALAEAEHTGGSVELRPALGARRGLEPRGSASPPACWRSRRGEADSVATRYLSDFTKLPWLIGGPCFDALGVGLSLVLHIRRAAGRRPDDIRRGLLG